MMRLPVRSRAGAGNPLEATPSAVQAGATTPQSFRARLGAKLKLVLEWMRERLFFFIRQ
ncbi:MAG TPA: hypothetical protein VGB07_05575 [Blastocatellia bacterium]